MHARIADPVIAAPLFRRKRAKSNRMLRIGVVALVAFFVVVACTVNIFSPGYSLADARAAIRAGGQTLAATNTDLDGYVDDPMEDFGNQTGLTPRVLRWMKAHNFTPEAGNHFIADYDITNLVQSPAYDITPTSAFRYIKPQEELGVPHFLLSYMPRVHYFPAFATPVEAERIRAAGLESLHRSQVAAHKDSNMSSVSDIRTSYQTWLPHNHESVRPLASRICGIMNMDCNIAEPVMVLRYKRGQKYVSHFDFFDPRWYGPQKSNRVATFFVYLSDVPVGGGAFTVLPQANGQPTVTNSSACDQGLRVRPVLGTATLFYDMRPDYKCDEYALHGGCPPAMDEYEKWAAVIWLRVNIPADLQARPMHEAGAPPTAGGLYAN